MKRRKLRGMATGFAPATVELVKARSDRLCEKCGRHPAAHLHHRLLRRFGNHTVANALHVCVWCHDDIHTHVGLSYDCGWMIEHRSGIAPEDAPVVYRGESVRLDLTGVVILLA